MIPKCEWIWNCQIYDVIDGDTIDVKIDCGFHSVRTERIRLLGINCPERGAPGGHEATEFTRDWITEEYKESYSGFVIQTSKSDSFGRYLGTIWRNHDGRCLNTDLLESGHAVEFRK